MHDDPQREESVETGARDEQRLTVARRAQRRRQEAPIHDEDLHAATAITIPAMLAISLKSANGPARLTV